MQLKVSSKGQVVLPIGFRNKFGIKEGDKLEAKANGSGLLLVPQKRKKRKGKIVKDPITGMPVLTFGPGAPIITCEMVDKLLEDFP
jgi:AbrB family looped-hinge helix DNA binding protein